MRKLLALFASLIMILALVGCGSPEEEQPEEQIDYEIALVTDAGLIMDGGYSEVAWTAISEFGATQGISHKYYKASEATEESYRSAIDDAVEKGAKVIVADGYSFEEVIYNAQKEHKDVKFILIDAEPINTETGKAVIAENTVAIMFSSEEAGYMAGYAAVENGASQLGFIGDVEKAEMEDYGYGFVQGANASASNNGVFVNIKYHYCNEVGDDEAIQKKVSEWYEDGTEVVFACGPQVERPVIQVAELNDEKVILCETDKSKMSDTVVASVVKDIAGVIELALNQYKSNKFPGGEVVEFDTSTDSIWIDMETSRFTDFNEGDYKDLQRKLSDKTVEVKGHDWGKISDLELYNVKIINE